MHLEFFLLRCFADQFDDVNNSIMMPKIKSNLPEMFFEIGVLKHFAMFTRIQLCRDSNTGFFCEYCEFFINNFFLENTCGCFCKGVPLVFRSSIVSLPIVYNMRELIFLPKFQKETLKMI